MPSLDDPPFVAADVRLIAIQMSVLRNRTDRECRPCGAGLLTLQMTG
jgi:hypothetical protein